MRPLHGGGWKKKKDVGKEIREHSSILDLPHIYDRPSHLWKATRRLDSESCRTTTNCSKASCTGPDGLMVGALLQTDFVARVIRPLLLLWKVLARQPPRQLAQISFELNWVLTKLRRCPVVSIEHFSTSKNLIVVES